MPCYVMVCHVVLFQVPLRYVAVCMCMLVDAMLQYGMMRDGMICCASMVRYANSWYVYPMLCRCMVWCVMLCHVMLWDVAL